MTVTIVITPTGKPTTLITTATAGGAAGEPAPGPSLGGPSSGRIWRRVVEQHNHK